MSVFLREVESPKRRLKDVSVKLQNNVEKWFMAVDVKDIDTDEKDRFTESSENLFIFLSAVTERTDQLMMLERSL